jgi:hypothetical protein
VIFPPHPALSLREREFGSMLYHALALEGEDRVRGFGCGFAALYYYLVK